MGLRRVVAALLVPLATVVFLFMPDGSSHVAAALWAGSPAPAGGREDVRLGPDRLWSPRPGVVRVRVDMPAPVALRGGPVGPVAVDLTLRAWPAAAPSA